ncbi:hypothetical protein H4R26_003136 [Coemansia thaxteri]|uniref:Uncharacterized protein n=1 Tax=Coemansia thaxteri TaxID=2663907 RepID=A0A9W8BJF6_9FUNG|nr:hypothetical protein H4R26_003136 [Coemansia thaxteri]KAJ2485832.1 hypothetical protein EV174_001487 [Coemansia sp. RSA 2320]
MALSETKRVAHAHSSSIHSTAIESTESRFMVSAGDDFSIKLYDLNSFETTATCTRKISPSASSATPAHNRRISCVEWYPVDNGMFTTSSLDHTLKVWDSGSLAEACVFDLESRVFCHRMSPTGAHALIAVADESAYMRLCDLRTGSFAQSLLAHHSGSMAVAWSPAQSFALVSGGNDGVLSLWDIRRADSHLYSFGCPDNANDCSPHTNEGPVVAHKGSVSSVLFAGDGSRVASIDSSGSLHVWDIECPQAPMASCQLSVAKGCNALAGPTQMALSSATGGRPNYEVLFCPGSGRSIAAVDMAAGQQIASLESHFAPTLCAAWRPSHLELYSSGMDGEIHIWCPPAAEELSEQQRRAREDTWSDSGEENNSIVDT